MRSLLLRAISSAVTPLLIALIAMVWLAVPGFASTLSFSPNTLGFHYRPGSGIPPTFVTLSDFSNAGDSFDITLSGHVDAVNPLSFILEDTFINPAFSGPLIEGATLLSAVGITSPQATVGGGELILSYTIPLGSSENWSASFKVDTGASTEYSFTQAADFELCVPVAGIPSACNTNEGQSGPITVSVIPEPNAALVFAAGFLVVASWLRRTPVARKT
jgi:hypothetical protein